MKTRGETAARSLKLVNAISTQCNGAEAKPVRTLLSVVGRAAEPAVDLRVSERGAVATEAQKILARELDGGISVLKAISAAFKNSPRGFADFPGDKLPGFVPLLDALQGTAPGPSDADHQMAEAATSQHVFHGTPDMIRRAMQEWDFEPIGDGISPPCASYPRPIINTGGSNKVSLMDYVQVTMGEAEPKLKPETVIERFDRVRQAWPPFIV